MLKFQHRFPKRGAQGLALKVDCYSYAFIFTSENKAPALLRLEITDKKLIKAVFSALRKASEKKGQLVSVPIQKRKPYDPSRIAFERIGDFRDHVEIKLECNVEYVALVTHSEFAEILNSFSEFFKHILFHNDLPKDFT